MTDHINPTHASLEAATLPMTLNAIAKRLHGATPTKTQLKATERELKALHQAGLLESTPGRGGLPYYSLITPAVPAAPKPSAAAVAVFAALDGGPTPAPDLAEQLREAHAERLAMSQTIIAICCAIGCDPSQTTTAELPQALRDYIDAQVKRETAELTGAIADIRAAIGDDGRQPLSEIAGKIKDALTSLGLDSFVLDVIRNTLAAVAADLVPNCRAATTTEPEAIRIMAQLIDAQHAHLHAQAMQIETLTNKLEISARAAEHHEQQIANLCAQLDAQAAQHQAETGLLADKNAKLHAEIEHLRSRPTPMTSGTTTPTPDAYLVTRHLRAGRGKTVADTDGPTRHKSIDTATRKARAAIRGGYVRAEIHATNLVAVAIRGAEIKPV